MNFEVSNLEMDTSKVDESLLHQKVLTSISQILRSRFSGSSVKQNYREYNDRVNFACPFCGDSHTNVHKKRGNLYSNFTYKCFNCGAYHTGMSFWEHVETLGLFYDHTFTKVEEMFIQQNVKTEWVAKIGSRVIDPSEDFSDFNKLAIPRSALIKKAGWEEAKVNKKASWYLSTKRKQIQKAQDWLKFAYDPKMDAIIIFNLTPSERVVGAQMRRFGSADVRYLTLDFRKLLTSDKYLGISGVSDDKIDSINSFSTLFGFFQLNFQMPITIFEGAFDAFKFPNGMATAGVNKEVELDFVDVRYFQDNDDAGKQMAIRKITEGESIFLWSKLLKDYGLTEYKIKDLSDLLQYINPTQVNWNNYFSESKLDLIDL